MLNQRVNDNMAQPVGAVKVEEVGDQPGLDEEHYEVGIDAETGVSCLNCKHTLLKNQHISTGI